MDPRQTRAINSRKEERGSVLAIAAISMLSLVLATGMAIDVSHLYTAKSELQNAADAAALAAASQLSSTRGGIKQAVSEATKTLNKYNFGSNVGISSADVTFSDNLNGSYVSQASAEASPASVRFVKVTLSPKPVGITFAALAIANPQNLTAKATAGISVGLTMNKFYTAYTFVESTSAPLVRTQTYALVPKAGNDKAPTSYRVLAGPNGDLILTGTVHAYGYIGSSYNVANLSSASMCSYAKIGMNTRFGDYTVHPGANSTEHPPDTVTEEGITYLQYRDKQAASAAPGMKNRRILTLPIVHNDDYNTTNRTVISDRLGAFFVKNKVGADCKLHVEYIGVPLAVPVGTFTPGSNQMSELTVAVLYK
ncbi:MAG TPA: pilus assembly protein TadG-related protein [Pyrinomonadaceae bacterium]|nr:pilus assembly protein TadG-related protein [Pyrinomonadaceae bacterium]